jgi:tetratricopeptide (TPR) repeat protein
MAGDLSVGTGPGSIQIRPQAEQNGGEKPPEETLKEGMQFYNLKQWDKALQKLLLVEADLLDGKERMEHTYYMGLCYTKLERYDDALLYLEQVVTAGGNALRSYQCRLTLAYIYLVTKRAKMAEFELRRLQQNGFESAQLYNTLAYAAWTQRRYKQAIEYYEQALDIDDTNTTAMNSMGYILADTGRDVTRGLRFCRKAVDRKPESAAYLDSLGWAYYKRGELGEARTWLRRALDLDPQHPEIIQHFNAVSGEAS